MKRTALYLRVSTTRQDQEGYSISLQKTRLIAYCKAKGWVVSGIFIDPGHSGASLERPGIIELMEAVEDGKFDIVLVYKLDRLSRSQKDTLYLIEDIFMANNVDFVSMQESFDTTTIYGRAMVGILSVFAQMERSTITERTLMGRAGRAEEGLWHGGGTDPIGYDYIEGELVINNEEAKQVRAVYNLYASGFSVTDICRRMDGYKTKHGDWSHTSTVGNVLDNPLYAGMVHFDSVLVRGRHTPIIDIDTDRKVKARRARLRRLEAAGDSNYLLTGIIYCKNCGARYFPHKRPNGKVVYSCHSRAKKNKKMIKDPTCKAPHIPFEELDTMVESEVLQLAENPSKVDEIIKKRAAEGDSNAGNISEEMQSILADINLLMDQLAQHDTLVSVEEIAGKIAEKYAQMQMLPRQEFVPRQYDIEAAKMLLHDIRYGWSELDLRGKRSFLFQLIDKVQIDAGDIRVEWSFE